MDQLSHHLERRKRRGQRGFTLIELLVVIAVLAILAVIVLFNVVGVVTRGTAVACSTDVSTIQTAVDGYLGDHGDFTAPVSTTSILTQLQAPPSGAPYVHGLNGTGKNGTNCHNLFSISGNFTSGYNVTGT